MKHLQSGKKYIELMIASCLIFLTTNAFAQDLLASALEGDVKDTFSGGAVFWKIFILIDVVLSAALAVKAKSPMVFVGVFTIAFVPVFIVKTFVF